jgi:hypothetical protein
MLIARTTYRAGRALPMARDQLALSRHERELVAEMLEDGKLPIIVRSRAATGSAPRLDWLWLGADMHLVVSAAPSGG